MAVVLDSSAQIAARWGYMSLWAEAMEASYSTPPSCPSWLEFSFYCYYGPDKSLWPDPLNRSKGKGPDVALIQSCALALLDGPDVLIRITERRVMHIYAEDVAIALEGSNAKITKIASRCKYFITVEKIDHCILDGKYKVCPFMGDKETCDFKGIKDDG